MNFNVELRLKVFRPTTQKMKKKQLECPEPEEKIWSIEPFLSELRPFEICINGQKLVFLE